MKCIDCNGTGLENENKVCITCNGMGKVGEDNSADLEAPMEPVVSKTKQVVSKIKKALKK